MTEPSGWTAARPSILIVDDEPVDLSLAAQILQPHCEVDLAGDAQEARGKLIGAPVELIVCDLNLPGESGMDLARWVLSRWKDEIAVVMVTGLDDPGVAREAFDVGAYGYLVKPYRRGDLINTILGALRRRQLEQVARRHRLELEQDVINKDLETQRMRQLLRRSEQSLERSRLETVHRLSMAVEMRDQVTRQHLSRMGSYCEEIARRLGMPDDFCETIAPAAQMHDIGKIGVPDHILLKVGPLTPREHERMETHTEIGRQILQGSESPILQLAESIAWTHHEKWDGTGYPRGLVGEEIPIEGRIASVADVYDSLIRDRPFRRATSLETAAQTMSDGRGTHFDPEVLDVFMSEIPSISVAS